jgi:hypothetical protein
MAEDPQIRDARVSLVGIVAALGSKAVDWQELSL